jgi:hypothetical protein
MPLLEAVCVCVLSFSFSFLFDIFIFVFLLFQIVTDEQTDLGILAHPLLSLILASDDAFQAVSTAFVKKQTV